MPACKISAKAIFLPAGLPERYLARIFRDIIALTRGVSPFRFATTRRIGRIAFRRMETATGVRNSREILPASSGCATLAAQTCATRLAKWNIESNVQLRFTAAFFAIRCNRGASVTDTDFLMQAASIYKSFSSFVCSSRKFAPVTSRLEVVSSSVQESRIFL